MEDISIMTAQREKFDYSKEHPLETTVRANRQKADVYHGLKENQIVFTNLPTPCPQLDSHQSVKDYLHSKVHRDLDVQKVEYVHAITAPDEFQRMAYIKVTLGNKRQAYMAKSALRKEWLGDCLVKVKVNEDVQKEHFNNRTVLVREIPRYLRVEHVLSIFGSKYGAVTNLELPTETIPIKDITLEQQQRIGTRVDDEKIAQVRQAELQIKQSLAVDQEYQSFIQETLDKETADSVLGELRKDPTLRPPEALDQERMTSLLTLITHLQAEGQTLNQYKLDLLELKSLSSAVGHEFTESTAQETESFVQKNSQKLKDVLTYLERTRSEQAVVGKVEDSLIGLINLTKGELMYAYDELLKKLEQRERILAERLKDSIQYFDENERILLEGRDFKREVNHVGDPFEPQNGHLEEFVSVNQQIADTYRLKNLSSEQVIFQFLKKELNPFITGNFTEEMVARANKDKAREWKYTTLPDIFTTKSQLRRKGLKSEFKAKYKEYFDKMLERVRNEQEVSFDEVYHREKQVIGAVIDAQKRLEARQAQMRSPMEHRLLDEKLLTAEQRSSIQYLLDEHKPRFEQSLDREQERALNFQIEKLDKQLGMVGKYQFAATDEQRWRAMVEQGELSESDLQKLIKMKRENDTQNLGYCFITFSHADEARMMLLLNKKPYFMEDKRLEFDLKALVDHGDLDMRYTVSRTKNDSQLTEELENLRNAKKELREFEKEMDSMLPQNRRLQKFREQAKALIEDHEFDSREQRAGGKMTEQDQARFDRKVRELEQKYPNVNFSQLYASDQAEAAKQALHKKAYASYKAFQFLKHGIKTSKEEPETKISKVQQRVIDNDPFNFPMMDDTVHKLLSKEVSAPTAIDNGDRITRPGRRTSISVQDYLESQFGKDMLRQPRQSIKDDDMFTFQETLKKRYPAEQFLKLADVEKKIQRLDDLGLEYDYKKFPQLKFKNDKIQALIDDNQNLLYEKMYGDKRRQFLHPKDPTRNLADDIDKRLVASMEKEEAKNGSKLNLRDINKSISKLRAEYGVKIRKNHTTEKMTSRFMEAINSQRLRFKRRTKAEKTARIVARKARRDAKRGKKTGAKFEASYDGDEERLEQLGFGKQPLDETQSLLNNEFFYAQKTRPTTEKLNAKINEKLQKEYMKKPREQRLDEEPPEKVDFREWLKGESHLRKAGTQYGGKLYRDARLGVDRVEDQFSKQRTGKGLETFFEDEEELDVYEEYRRKAAEKPVAENERFNKFQIDQQELQPEMPRFDQFFDSKSKGLHPFDSIANSFDDSEVRTNADDDFEKLEEEALYRRELMGRLMGQKITPRQFEVLTGQFRANDTRSERFVEIGKHQFLNKRDNIRLIEEHIEKYRRSMVLQGNWTEEESQVKTKEWLNKMVEESTPNSVKKKLYRDATALHEAIRSIDNPESLFEKEYHFDEGLGMSLADHMASLRKEYPGATVMSRRDRDGYAIIKLQFRPEYKYEFDSLVNFDYEHELEKFHRTLEELLRRSIGDKNLLQSFDEKKLQAEIQRLASEPQMVPDLSSFAKFKIAQLVQERLSGVYKNNDEGFINALMSVMQSENTSKYETTQMPSLFDLKDQQTKTVVEEIFEERDRFRADISDQLRRRVVKYRNFTKRTEADFIKPKVNEFEALANQKVLNDAHIADLQHKSVEMEGNQNKDEFDKDAYYKLKDELRQRKEAKERLLSQGLPQFKAYMRF